MDKIIFRQFYAAVLKRQDLSLLRKKLIKKLCTKNAHDTLNIITFYYKFGNMLFLTNPQ